LLISENIQSITNTKDYNYLAYKKIKDIVVDKEPLGGIYTALVYSETEMNLILSCDIPLISTEMLQELIEKHTTNSDVSVSENTDRIHPLIGIYSTRILPVLKKIN
jgi:molybdopterin-guanine dinucleotide biosynthesis protein A